MFIEKSISWKKIENLTDKIVEEIRENNKKYDWIISIQRGGLIPGVLISQKLGVKHAVASISHYIGKEKHEIKDLYISMVGDIFPKDHILIIDDIADSGDSIKEAIKIVKKEEPLIKNIDTATLYYKPHSMVKPTFYGKEIKNNIWAIFPWEHDEKQKKEEALTHVRET